MLWLRNFLLEVGPLIVFFVVEYTFGFFPSVVATIGATALAVLVSRVCNGGIPLLAIITLPVFALLGSLSFFLKDEQFFILTDTIFYTGFAGALFLSLFYKRTLLDFMFTSSFAMTKRGWRILTVRWAVFFLLLAVGNEYVRVTSTPDMWVTYKLWVTIGIVVFGCYQFTLSARERIPAESNRLGLRTK